MQSIILALCFFGLPSAVSSVETYVDLIELNAFYDCKGRLVYEQVIFWEIAPETGRLQVRAWCLVEDREVLNRRPVRNEVSGFYHVDWRDTDVNVTRKITSRTFHESWTQVDRERENKKVHDERLRIALPRRLKPEY